MLQVRENWYAQLVGEKSNFRVLREQCHLGTHLTCVALDKVQVKLSGEILSIPGHDEQDPSSLAPVHLLPDGNDIVVLIKLDDLGFHTTLMLCKPIDLVRQGSSA